MRCDWNCPSGRGTSETQSRLPIHLPHLFVLRQWFVWTPRINDSKNACAQSAAAAGIIRFVCSFYYHLIRADDRIAQSKFHANASARKVNVCARSTIFAASPPRSFISNSLCLDFRFGLGRRGCDLPAASRSFSFLIEIFAFRSVQRSRTEIYLKTTVLYRRGKRGARARARGIGTIQVVRASAACVCVGMRKKYETKIARNHVVY